jgi:hypothetical protein
MSATTRHEKLRALAIRCEEQRKLISGLAVENAALNEEVERLRELTRWIPVGERLPEPLVYVPVYGSGNHGFERGALSQFGLFFPEWVTHWMPLPEPPEKDGEG